MLFVLKSEGLLEINWSQYFAHSFTKLCLASLLKEKFSNLVLFLQAAILGI